MKSKLNKYQTKWLEAILEKEEERLRIHRHEDDESWTTFGEDKTIKNILAKGGYDNDEAEMLNILGQIYIKKFTDHPQGPIGNYKK